jgi:hypothetical protein
MSTMYVNNIAPLEGNTINVASGNTLYAPGSVIAVYNSNSSSELSTSSQTYANLGGMSVTLTPVSVSSKFFITYTNHIYLPESPNLEWRAAGTQILRNSTVITTDGTNFAHGTINADISEDRTMTYITRQYLDSPNTTSSITYQIQGNYSRGARPADGAIFNRTSYGNGGVITVMEIAG